MEKRINPTKVVTGVVRLSYANVHEPKSINGGTPKYSVSLIIPKTDAATVAAINKAIDAAIEEGRGKFGGKIPARTALKLPLRDGDVDRPDDPAYAGCYFVNATSSTAPEIVDKARNPMQLDSLRSLTRKVTVAFESERVSRSCNVSSLEDAIIRMMETEDELNRRIDTLTDIKNSITQFIGALENIDYQLLLEKRYLCFMSWDQIAAESGCSLRWIHTLHSRALVAFEKVLLDGGVNI